MEGAYVGDNGHCSVNAFVGREDEKLLQNGSGRKAVIIGAGAAGLYSAELLARRGFDVTVLEKENCAGGQLNLADKPPHKEKIHWCIEDLLANVESLGVEIKYNTIADKKLIASLNPEIVICATGGNAVHPAPFKSDNTVTVTEILNGSVKPENKNICVIGSGMTGLETSELLCELGNKVTIVEMADSIAPGAWFQSVDDALPKLKEANTKFLTSTKLKSINGKSITAIDLKHNKEIEIPCDMVVLSMGVKPDNSLFEEIKNEYKFVFNIGDSNKTGRIHNATEDAYNIVKSIK